MKALIIDDEKKAREGIKLLLKNDREIDILGEAKNGKEAIDKIRIYQPDLIFLDIQMPGINGFDVLGSLEEKEWPIVIFVTAYDQYALKAFEVQALDYLLKPLDADRFYKALLYAKSYHKNLSNRTLEEKLRKLLLDYQKDNKENWIGTSKQESQTQLIIKSSGKVFFLQIDDIYWIEALDSYVKIHQKNRFHVVKSSLKSLENRLSHSLTRIHRSHLVNFNKVELLEPYFNGDFYLVLNNGAKIKGSRNFKKNLPKII